MINYIQMVITKMGQAGFEPATSHSEGGYPIQTRLLAQ